MSHSDTPRVLAGIFAHPDDEVFGSGGLFASAAASGVRCALYCATDGDAGRASGTGLDSREALGRRRREELRAATEILGITTLHMAGHPDGGLREVDADRLTGEVVHFLREQRPDVVVTFGPEGAPNQHRDHRAISRATTAAFFLAGNSSIEPERDATRAAPWQPSRLYYVTWPAPAPNAELPVRGAPMTASVSVAEYIATKRAAFMAHVTQRDHLARFEELGAGPDEWFALAAGLAQPAPRVDSLFAGLPPRG